MLFPCFFAGSVELELFEMAKTVGTDWQRLASLLGVSSLEVKSIERDIATTRDRAFKMLRTWYWKCGSRVNLDDVHSILTDIRRDKRVGESASE